MKNWTMVAAVLCVTAGCVGRVALYAPRLTPSEEHREATDNRACRECHDPSERPSHDSSDDCRRCHTLARGT